MQRREFLAGVAALVSVKGAHAQQTARRPRVGILIYSTPDQDPNTQAFVEGLRQLGYVDGQNVTFEYRFAQGRPERLPELAADLVGSKPDVIFALGGDVTPHVAKATQTIPIVYAMSPDPVLLGLAASLGKPGGNSTGVTFLSDQLAAKRLETFREAAPRLSRVGVVRDPSHADNEMPVAQRAAQALKLDLQAVEIREPADIDRALAAAKQANVDGLYIVSSRKTVTNVQRIVEFANRERLPLVGGWGAWVQAGGLMSYGPNVADMVRQASTQVDRVLKGVKPGDLPIQQPTRFELLVNLKTAKALGLNIPDSFLLRAEKVIE
ncbi:MAG TPA: ABC transporter substrate-binding protein [Pseudolabrys sp.]|nr:ABC transporter substrate-binding protein [Pseudolabrys sp.]